MKDKLIKYLLDEKIKLDSKKVDVIKLTNVSPSLIEEVFGDFDDTPEFNGWQGDYWASSGEYSVSGCMYYGTASVSRKEDE